MVEMLNNGKFVKDEVFRSKLENVVSLILKEILEQEEVSSSNYLKLKTALGHLGFIVPDNFIWETLWDKEYTLENGGLADGDNIFSYYFANRKSIRHVPEWLKYAKKDKEVTKRAFLPSKALAAEWFSYVIDYEDLKDKLAQGLKLVNRTEEATVITESNGVSYNFDFKPYKDGEGKSSLKITISSIIIPKDIPVEYDADTTSEGLAAFLAGVLKGYFGYIAGIYK